MKRGFGLLDLMIGAALVVVLTGLLMTNLQGLRQAIDFENAGQEISSRLALAKMRAAAKMTRCALVFDFANDTLWLEVFDPAQSGFLQEGGAYRLPEGIRFLASGGGSLNSNPRIVFNSRGISTDNNGVPTDSQVLIHDGRELTVVSVSSAGDIRTGKVATVEEAQQ